MKISLRPLTSITPYDRNPRNNDAAVDAVAASIRQFGFRKPIVVDADGVIICGHTCFRAAEQLGLAKVPVHVARELTPDQVRAYRIADNRTGELADWDLEKLGLELADLRAAEYDITSLMLGDDWLAEALAGTAAGLTDPDDVPAPPDAAVTQPGDLIFLGNHRLLCGDSAKRADVDRLVDGAPIHLVNTDPPYNVKVEPRSNNAIAAGLSSFAGPTHHQGLDVARDPGKAKPTQKKLRPKDRPLANDFLATPRSPSCSTPGSRTRRRCSCPAARSTSGAAMPTSPTTRRRSRLPGCIFPRRSSGTSNTRCSRARISWARTNGASTVGKPAPRIASSVPTTCPTSGRSRRCTTPQWSTSRKSPSSWPSARCSTRRKPASTCSICSADPAARSSPPNRPAAARCCASSIRSTPT